MKILRRILPFVFIVLFANGNLFSADKDPLAVEIARWQEFVRTNPATDEDWKSIRDVSGPVLIRAEHELAKGRRFFALHLLALVRANLAAEKFLAEHPAEARQEVAAFEKEWRKIGTELAPVLDGEKRPEFNGLPAAVRAVAEASFSEIKVYYDASLEYGRNTVADAGMFYLGSAKGQLDFAQFCSALDSSSSTKQLNIGSLPKALNDFEDKILAEYKPPVSIDQHPIFIRVSAMIKQARELDEAGMHHGALYRYLEARYRFFRALAPGDAILPEEAHKRAQEFQKRFDQESKDHTIGRLFVEIGLGEAEDTTPDSKGATNARVIFDDVLPHYFAALEPTKIQPLPTKPSVTVTLIRWPYT